MAPRNRSAVGRRRAVTFKVKKSGEATPKYPANTINYNITSIVLSSESKSEFQELLNAYYKRFQPANGVESDFVDDMIAAHWRLRRTSMIKAEIIKLRHHREQATLPFLTFKEASNTLRYCSLAETTLSRNFNNAAAELRRMQKDRPLLAESVTFEKNAILRNEGNTLSRTGSRPYPSAA